MVKEFSLPILSKKIAFSTLVQVFGKGIQLLISAVTLKLISNFLVQGDYGVYAKISEYALFFSVAANLGIFGNLVREMSKKPDDGKAFVNALVLRLLTAGIFFATAILYVVVAGFDRVFILGTVFFCSALFFDYVTSVCDAVLQANYMMGRATVALVSGRAVNLVLIFLIVKSVDVFAASGWSVPVLFIAGICGGLVTAVLSLIFVARKIKWEWKLDGQFMWKLFKFGLPFGIINIVNALYFRFLPDFFVSKYVLNDAQFAAYNISYKAAFYVSLFSTFLVFSLLPGFKQYIENKDWEKARLVYKKVLRMLIVAGIFVVVAGSVLGPKLLELLTHKKYFLPEFWYILPMMLILAAVSYFYDLVLIVIFAFENEKWFLKREFIALALALAVSGIGYFISGSSNQAALALFIGSAIAGEAFMVVSGLRKIRKIY